MSYRTPAALEMAIKAAAKASPMDTNRAIAGFYFHRFLCRIFHDRNDMFVLKGGLSLLARTVDARYTRDIDLLARGKSLQSALEELKTLASYDLGDFVRFDFEGTEPIKADDEYREGAYVSFSAWLGGKRVQTVSIDLVLDVVENVSVEVLTPHDRIELDGIPACDYRVYGVEDALADKLFGIIEAHGGRPSSRVKDLVDIAVYASTCRVDGAALRKNLAKESALRKVPMPSSFSVPPTWHEDYRAVFKKLCSQTGLGENLHDMAVAEKLARSLFNPVINPALTSADFLSVWSPERLAWPGEEGLAWA